MQGEAPSDTHSTAGALGLFKSAAKGARDRFRPSSRRGRQPAPRVSASFPHERRSLSVMCDRKALPWTYILACCAHQGLHIETAPNLASTSVHAQTTIAATLQSLSLHAQYQILNLYWLAGLHKLLTDRLFVFGALCMLFIYCADQHQLLTHLLMICAGDRYASRWIWHT